RFVDYRLVTPESTTVLDGNRLAGVPERALRLGARARWGGTTVDVDHSTQGALFGDDRNEYAVRGWGRGQLNIRLAHTRMWNGWRAEPFVSVQNAFDQRYVAAVTLNGSGGRVLESAPGRN